MSNPFLPPEAEDPTAGFQIRDLLRFFLVDIILIAGIKLFLALGVLPGPDSYVLAILASKAVLFVYLLWLIHDRRGAWTQTGATHPGRWWSWPLSLALYAAAYPAVLWADRLGHGAAGWIYGLFGQVYIPAPQDAILFIFNDILDAPTRLALIAFTVLAGPFMEELAFRGMGMDAFRRRFGVGGAVALTSLLFGAYHFSVSLFIPLSVLGAVFAAARVVSRSLWCSFFLHMFHNAFALAVTAYELGLFARWLQVR